MSEQMSARELAREIRRDSPFGGLTYEQAEALILADRKATVERYVQVLRDIMKKHNTAMNAVQIICTEKTLDSVLEDKNA